MNSFKKLLRNFSILMSLGVVATVFFIGQIQYRSTAINSNWLPSSIHIGTVNTLTSDFRIDELQHVLSLTPDQMNFYEGRMRQKSDLIRMELAQYEPLITTDMEKTLYADFKTKWTEYLTESHTLMSLSKENRTEEAKIHLRGRSETLFDAYSRSLTLLVEENKRLAADEGQSGFILYMISVLMIIAMTIVLLVFLRKASLFLKGLYARLVNTCVNIMAENAHS